MEVNKVTFGGNTLIDLTEDTVTEDTLLEGATAHNSKGERIEGKMIAGDMFKDTYDTDGDGKVDNADNADKLGGYSPDHYASKKDIPTKVSDLENDKGYLNEHQSLEGYAKKAEIPVVPTKVSEFENDKGYLVDETDPTVPSWAKDPNKPVYNAEEVGADEKGTAVNTTFAHNTDTDAHSDMRLLIQGLIARLDTVANSSDTDLDQLSEIVAYIKNNKSLIDGVTTSKVNVSDIINNLTTNATDRPLSATQGVVLKALIDAITVPTKVSQLENDRGYLTQHQSLADYAKKSEIPSIPSSLPANGGDADTVGGIGIRVVDDINDTGRYGYLTVII